MCIRDRFKDAVTDFIARERITVSEFDGRLNWMLALYPEEVCLRMYNPVSYTHLPAKGAGHFKAARIDPGDRYGYRFFHAADE